MELSRFRNTPGQNRAFISGKVVLDDGTQLTESASIQTICRGHKQTVTHTDSHGGFSFELGDRMGAMAAGISAADVDSSSGPSSGGAATNATGATVNFWPTFPASLRSPSI